jgi:hypothetical protein
MALTDGGQLSLGDIANEKGVSLSNVSLRTESITGINTDSPAYPNASAPYSISEFHGYDHTYTSEPPPVEVHPFNITEFTFDPGEACFLPELPTKYKTGNPEIISVGDVFYNDEYGLSPLVLDDGQRFSTYFNEAFGKLVFEYAEGQVNNAFVQGCGKSERRLKYNIEFIGESPMGIPMYHFNYKNEKDGVGRFVGTMVDDLQRLGFEDALIYGDDAIYVNYSKIDVPFELVK